MEADTKTNKHTTTLLIKSSFWYVISGFLTRAIGFITIPIFTRLLTNEQVGDFSVYSTWQSILAIICGIESYNTINRARFDYQEKKDFDAYITSCLALSSIVTFSVLILYIMLPQVFHKILLIDDRYMAILFAYLFTSPAFSMFQMEQRVMYKYKLSAWITFSIIFSSSLLAVLFVLNMDNDRLFGRIFGQYILEIAAGAVFYIYFLKRSFSIRKSYFKYALRLGLPLVFSFLGSRILLSSDNLVVKHMCLSVQVSYIALVHSAAHIVLMLVQMLNSAWTPWFYDKLNVGQANVIERTYKIYVWLTIAGTFGVLLFAPEIILVLGGKQYGEAVSILPPNIISGVFTVLTAQMVNLETYHKKTKYAAWITGAVAAINIVLNIIGVTLWDYRAVCYVTVACHMLSVLIHYHYTKAMGIRELIKPVDMALFILVPLLLIPISLLLYMNTIIRLSVILILAALALGTLYMNRGKMIDMVRKLKGRR